MNVPRPQRRLEQTLDMEIGRLEMESGVEWVIYNPMAGTMCKSNGQITIEGLGKVNASKPLHRGEMEYFDIRRAANYFSMPERLARMEKRLEQHSDLLKSILATKDEACFRDHVTGS